MITQRLVLIDPPAGTVGLHFTDTKIWACAGCRATIGEGFAINHPDDCPEMASASRPAVAAYRKRIAALLEAVAERRSDAEFEQRLEAVRLRHTGGTS